jgi:hypothetical protein
MRPALQPGGRFDWLIPLIVIAFWAAVIFLLGVAFARYF